MLVNHSGNIYNVTNKLTLEQLLKYGAALVEETKVSEDAEVEKEIVADNKKTEPKKYTRKK